MQNMTFGLFNINDMTVTENLLTIVCPCDVTVICHGLHISCFIIVLMRLRQRVTFTNMLK